MKQIAITFFAASLLFACKSETKDPATNDTSKVVEVSKSEEWVPVDSATAMKMMMETGTPGQEHAMLAKANGAWKAETTMWMTPDGPPMTSLGNVTNKMVMGGRFQVMTFSGDMMGQAFEGTGTTGYDIARKVWTSTWVDNMSTGILNMDGTWDDATKTTTYTGKMFCPANGKTCEIKQTVKIVDDTHQVMEMYGPDMKTGKLYKNMEIKLTKK